MQSAATSGVGVGAAVVSKKRSQKFEQFVQQSRLNEVFAQICIKMVEAKPADPLEYVEQMLRQAPPCIM
ncbi:hypothetical protein Pelo_12537 [Pelomyxa schiedti]|nr:hypothetical protein Pelo_12537 [Pelomyxa schiedti]